MNPNCEHEFARGNCHINGTEAFEPAQIGNTVMHAGREGSIGDELDRFFGVLHDQPLADGVSPSAFCHARMQLDPRALLALSRPLLEGFERDFTPRAVAWLASVGNRWFDGAFAEHRRCEGDLRCAT